MARAEMNFRLVLLLWLLNYSSAQDVNCDYYQDIPVGNTYYINNPYYPDNYRPGTTCRWIASCPAGYNVRLDCPVIRLPQNRIVGGQETGVNEYTMMAGLVDRRITEIKCAGVIISQKHVLTAAYCVDRQQVTNYAVVVGERHVTSGLKNFDNDIAIVTVAANILFGILVQPVCLPFRFANESFGGSDVILVGWDVLKNSEAKSDVLLKTNQNVLQQNTCSTRGALVTDQQMCTSSRGKDSYQGDPGDPLFWTDPATGALHCVGIISYGRYCASDVPGISTRVTAFLSWIRANTETTDFCVK